MSGLLQSSGGSTTTGFVGSAGALGAVGSPYGGQIGLRAWVSERVVLVPLLHMGISHTSTPETTSNFGPQIEGAEFTDGLFAASLSLGYAAYRGKSTRFLLLGGLSFGYAAQSMLVAKPTTDGSGIGYHYELVKTVGFAVPVGFALEQFFSPRLSVVVGAESPVFSYSSMKVGTLEPTKTIGADLESTRLNASLCFYTD